MTDAQFSAGKDQLIVASYSKLTDDRMENDHAFIGVVCVWNSRALFGPNMYGNMFELAYSVCIITPLGLNFSTFL